jgi:hypothetical protein
MSDQRYEFLIGIHEAIEAYLASHAGVSPEAVDKFDKAYEAKRKAGDDSETGDDPKAPYYRHHQIATGIGCSPASSVSTGRLTIVRCRANRPLPAPAFRRPLLSNKGLTFC